MANAFSRVLQDVDIAVIIGSDCLELTAAIIEDAFSALERFDAVIGPARDGGYYLLGMKQFHPELFAGKQWSTSTVFQDTVADLRALGLAYTALPVLSDIDDIDDLRRSPLCGVLRRVMPKISIVIPTFNEAVTIRDTIQHLKRASCAENVAEIIVVDGRSTDKTADVAAQAGATVVSSARGRAIQLNTGATRARGNILYFVHADTRPPRGFDTAIIEAVKAGYAAGSFRLAFDDPHPLLRVVAWFSRFKHRWCRAGDQSLFISRPCFHAIGMYRTSCVIMEDVEIIPRIQKRCTFTVVPYRIVSSARKYRLHGILRLQATYILMRILDVQRHSPGTIAMVYRRLVH
jgi:rSAM/selenodomain-associated transferase 2